MYKYAQVSEYDHMKKDIQGWLMGKKKDGDK